MFECVPTFHDAVSNTAEIPLVSKPQDKSSLRMSDNEAKTAGKAKVSESGIKW